MSATDDASCEQSHAELFQMLAYDSSCTNQRMQSRDFEPPRKVYFLQGLNMEALAGFEKCVSVQDMTCCDAWQVFERCDQSRSLHDVIFFSCNQM